MKPAVIFLLIVISISLSIFQGAFIQGNLTTGNYGYDEIGNLIKDNAEQIKEIKWNVYGKIQSICRTVTGPKPNLRFEYDASGNRVAKFVYANSSLADPFGSLQKATYYMRDAQGNIMATYDETFNNLDLTYICAEHDLYGSSRIGLNKTNLVIIGSGQMQYDFTYSKRTLSQKNFEGSNHLGNVLTVFTDRRIAVDNNVDGTTDYYLAEVISSTDYYAFGMVMQGRSFAGTAYRYGFNGKEKDNEINVDGGDYDFGARIYDGRLGRWLSLDPSMTKYPKLNPYNFVDNSPIYCIDGNGKDIIILCAQRKAYDPEEPHPTGHMALLVGDDKNGWSYFSFDGPKGTNSNDGKTIMTGEQKFKTMAEFAKSEYNTYKDNYDDKEGTESSHRGEDGKILQRFQYGYQITTLPVDDKKVINAVSSYLANATYGVQTWISTAPIGDVCTDVTKVALNTLGLNDGKKTTTTTTVETEESGIVTLQKTESNYLPATIYNEIKKNKGESIDDKLKRPAGTLPPPPSTTQPIQTNPQDKTHVKPN
jgi:RHS repeat-associated protein